MLLRCLLLVQRQKTRSDTRKGGLLLTVSPTQRVASLHSVPAHNKAVAVNRQRRGKHDREGGVIPCCQFRSVQDKSQETSFYEREWGLVVIESKGALHFWDRWAVVISLTAKLHVIQNGCLSSFLPELPVRSS